MIRRHVAGYLRGAYSRQLDPLEAQKSVEALMKPGALTAALNYYRCWPFGIPKANVPCLLLYGANDPYILESSVRASSHYTRAPFELKILHDAGHWVQLDQPDRVNRELTDWFLGSTA